MKKCLVIGAAMLDVVMNLDRLPTKGGDIYAKSQTMNVGGCAYNVADILKHFKVPYTLMAPLGKGYYSDIIREKLSEAGHDSFINVDSGDNGYCLCLVEKDGERTFITLPGVECSYEKEWFDRVEVTEYESVYVSGYEIEGNGGENILEFLEKNKSLKVYYAPGPRITYIDKEKQRRIFSLNPTVHLNEEEALSFTEKLSVEEAAEAIHATTGSAVIITQGDKGAFLYDQAGRVCEKVISEPAKVVDTIGAGDSHIGAVIALLTDGLSYAEAITVANRVSAAIVSVKGPSLTDEEFNKIDIL